MNKKALFVGNWKMHFLPKEVGPYVAQLLELLPSELFETTEVALAVPHPLIPIVGEALAGSPVALAAQNVHWDDQGAHTGEVSPQLLQALGVRFALIGHSERRQMYGETDASVAQRVAGALRLGIRPVVCVGETEREYRDGQSAAVTLGQLLAAIEVVSQEQAAQLVVAYEPVWAIGTGLAATPEHAAQQHGVIREALEKKFGAAAERVAVLYGGSTKPENIEELVSVENVDGALPGGSSLKADVFASLINKGSSSYARKLAG